MKILELISAAGYYGAESAVVTLAKALHRAGDSVVVGVFSNLHCGKNSVAERARNAGLRVFEPECNGRFDPHTVRAIRAFLLEEGVQMLHTHGYKADLYGSTARAGTDIPIVATCHHGVDRHPTEDLSMWIYDRIDLLALRAFDRVVAVSEPIAAWLRKSGIVPGKLSVIQNGIDIEKFDGSPRPALRDELNLGRRPVIGTVGRLHPEKGARFLILAAREVLQQHPDAVFAFVGEGPERAELEALARETGVAGSVVFTGARVDMPPVYQSFNILVLPSLNEGTPMTLIEAMAMRRPVIATDVGGVGKVVSDGETGLLVKAGDPAALGAAVLRLLGNAELCAALSSRAYTLARERFSDEVMTRAYREVLSKACLNRSTRGEPRRRDRPLGRRGRES
jgi:glycosyltransferase involved in cell wall biosynthesis